MRTQDIRLLPALGLAMWIIGTIYYAYTGPSMLETTSLRYWICFIISPLISVGICIRILRWRQIPKVDWASAILLMSVPGMIGEALVLTNLGTFLPKLHASSGGKYGALLFATYAVVLGVAEVATLRAR